MKAQQRNQRYDPNVANTKKDKPPTQAKSEGVQENISSETVAPKQTKAKGKKQAPKQQSKGIQQNENIVSSSQAEPAKSLLDSDEWVTVSNRKGRKNKKNSLADVQVDQNIIDDNANEVASGVTLKVSNESGTGKKGKQRPAKEPTSESNGKVKKDNSKKSSSKVTAVVETAPSHDSTDTDGVQADPAKKLRNLKKRLREIEVLKTKDIATLDKDQVEKVKRYKEIKKLVKQMEETL